MNHFNTQLLLDDVGVEMESVIKVLLQENIDFAVIGSPALMFVRDADYSDIMDILSPLE